MKKAILIGAILLLLASCATSNKSYSNNSIFLCIKDYVSIGINPTEAYYICRGIFGAKRRR